MRLNKKNLDEFFKNPASGCIRSECIIMIGCPGSGKTYQSERYVKKGYVRISQDDQGKNGHMLEFNTAMSRGQDIVIDRMNFNKKQRKKYAIPAAKAGYKIIYHRMVVLEEKALERCINRKIHPTIKDPETAEKVIKFFNKKWEDIDFNNEPFDELIMDG